MTFCPICAHEASISLGKRSHQGNLDFYAQFVNSPIERFDREIKECLQCGLQYIHPMYEEPDFLDLYEDEAYQRFREAIKSIVQNQESFKESPRKHLSLLRSRFAELGLEHFLNTYKEKHDGKCPKLLDIGSGDGHELHIFSTMGFDVTGIDLCDPLIEQVKEQYGLEVKKTAMEDLDPTIKYDVITAFHLIEHLKNPHVLFTKAKELLNPGGIFLIETPFMEDGSATMQRYRDIYHTMFFDHFTLTLLAAKNGFCPICSLHPHFYGGDYFHSFMTMIFQYNAVFEESFAPFQTIAVIWMKSVLSTLVEDARTWGRDSLRYHHKL